MADKCLEGIKLNVTEISVNIKRININTDVSVLIESTQTFCHPRA